MLLLGFNLILFNYFLKCLMFELYLNFYLFYLFLYLFSKYFSDLMAFLHFILPNDDLLINLLDKLLINLFNPERINIRTIVDVYPHFIKLRNVDPATQLLVQSGYLGINWNFFIFVKAQIFTKLCYYLCFRIHLRFSYRYPPQYFFGLNSAFVIFWWYRFFSLEYFLS